MPDVQLTPNKPIVSIIVPMADDAVDGAQRLANAQAQTWPHCEIVAVYTEKTVAPSGAIHLPGGSLAAAINAGISASKGDHLSLLLPGASYLTEKITKQVEFIGRFELQDAVVFCNHTILDSKGLPAKAVTLPSVDPLVMFRKLYCGFPLQHSSLLFPRQAFDVFGPLNEETPQSSLHEFCLRLSKHRPFVGMADRLISIARRDMGRREKRQWRGLYARMLPELLSEQQSSTVNGNLFATLGEAAMSRFAEGLPLAAWDTVRAMMRALSGSPHRLHALQSFSTPLLRGTLRHLPDGVKRLLRTRVHGQNVLNTARLDFPTIYRENGFVGTESLSGAGSTLFQTRIIRREVPLLFRRLGVTSVLDIPCGDFHWMRDVDLAGMHYTGADVVDEIVEINQRRFGGGTREFKRVDLISGPLPTADLVFCRDCLVHLPFEDAVSAIDSIRNSRCQWLLTTTFTRTDPNKDLDDAGWRPLNLTLPPFNFPPPELLISEKCTEAGGLAGDKALGLWRVADLQDHKRT